MIKGLIEAIDRLQTQTKPLLAASVYKNANTHQIMLSGGDEIAGSPISYVAVKGVTTWAMFYVYGQRSEHYIAANGHKASQNQVKNWIDIEGDLMELYRG